MPVGRAISLFRTQRLQTWRLTEANGHAERIAALHMIEPRGDRPRPITLGADKACDAEDLVNELRSMNATPPLAQNANGRSSAIDGRTTRHAGYAVSQRIPANGSRRPSAGSRPSPTRSEPRSAVARASDGLSPSQPPPTIWAAAEAHGGGMNAPANCRLIGRWRIVEADLWDRAQLDLCGPARLTITAQSGEIAFGALGGRPRRRICPRLDGLSLGGLRGRRRGRGRRNRRTSRRRRPRDRVRVPKRRRSRP